MWLEILLSEFFYIKKESNIVTCTLHWVNYKSELIKLCKLIKKIGLEKYMSDKWVCDPMWSIGDEDP